MNRSSNSELCGPLQDWLESLPQTMPLTATTDSPLVEGKRLEHWLAVSNLPADSLVAALLWLRIGVIDPTHEIVQRGSTSMEGYLHGVVHRLEGDYWNSNYWFKQVRDSPLLQSLSKSMQQKLHDAGLTSIAASLKIFKSNKFEPTELVAAIENQVKQIDRDSYAVNNMERICWLEWSSLWEIV